MRLIDIAKLLPLLPLITVVVFGVRLGWHLLKASPASMVVLQDGDASGATSAVPAGEMANAQDDARRLTINAESLANRAKLGDERPDLRFPSLSEMVENQAKAGLLSPADAARILSNNTSRDAAVRLRVGYVYITNGGVVFPIVTNDVIDKTIGNTNNPADMALYILGIRDANSPASASDGTGNDTARKLAATQIPRRSIPK